MKQKITSEDLEDLRSGDPFRSAVARFFIKEKLKELPSLSDDLDEQMRKAIRDVIARGEIDG